MSSDTSCIPRLPPHITAPLVTGVSLLAVRKCEQNYSNARRNIGLTSCSRDCLFICDLEIFLLTYLLTLCQRNMYSFCGV